MSSPKSGKSEGSKVPDSSQLGAEINRQYSQNSTQALSKLDNLDSAFASMAQRVANLDKAIDPNSLESIVTAKNDLAQIIGDLERLQFNEVAHRRNFIPPIIVMFKKIYLHYIQRWMR